MISDKEFKLLKKKFLACDYIENTKFKTRNGKTTHEDSILSVFCDRLDINVAGRARFFMNNNVVGFYGNKRVVASGTSYKIFEILNLIMENLQKDLIK